MIPRPKPRRRLLESLGLLALLAAIVLENVLCHTNPSLALSPIGVSLSAFFLVCGTASLRWYYGFFGVIMAGVSLLPLLTRTSVGDPVFGNFSLVFSIFFGLGVIFTGLLDHLGLLRYFRPSEGGNHIRLE